MCCRLRRLLRLHRNRASGSPPPSGKLCDIEAHNVSVEVKDAYDFAGKCLSTLAGDPDFLAFEFIPKSITASCSGGPPGEPRFEPPEPEKAARVLWKLPDSSHAPRKSDPNWVDFDRRVRFARLEKILLGLCQA